MFRTRLRSHFGSPGDAGHLLTVGSGYTLAVADIGRGVVGEGVGGQGVRGSVVERAGEFDGDGVVERGC